MTWLSTSSSGFHPRIEPPLKPSAVRSRRLTARSTSACPQTIPAGSRRPAARRAGGDDLVVQHAGERLDRRCGLVVDVAVDGPVRDAPRRREMRVAQVEEDPRRVGSRGCGNAVEQRLDLRVDDPDDVDAAEDDARVAALEDERSDLERQPVAPRVPRLPDEADHRQAERRLEHEGGGSGAKLGHVGSPRGRGLEVRRAARRARSRPRRGTARRRRRRRLPDRRARRSRPCRAEGTGRSRARSARRRRPRRRRRAPAPPTASPTSRPARHDRSSRGRRERARAGRQARRAPSS